MRQSKIGTMNPTIINPVSILVNLRKEHLETIRKLNCQIKEIEADMAILLQPENRIIRKISSMIYEMSDMLPELKHVCSCKTTLFKTVDQSSVLDDHAKSDFKSLWERLVMGTVDVILTVHSIESDSNGNTKLNIRIGDIKDNMYIEMYWSSFEQSQVSEIIRILNIGLKDLDGKDRAEREYIGGDRG